MPFKIQDNHFCKLFQLCIYIVCLTIFSFSELKAQSKPLHDIYKNDCIKSIDPDNPVEIFKIMMIPPVFKTYSQEEFFQKIRGFCEEENFDNKETNIIINYLILLDQGICVSDIQASTFLSERFTANVRDLVESVSDFAYGKHVGKDFSSAGNFTITIKKGKLKSLQLDNGVFER
ncbi:MAG: hypothetical protein IPN79_17110 [Saprospiraceae bacterium]|nr:hypothetical protein [Saprospiraceae bacterium]